MLMIVQIFNFVYKRYQNLIFLVNIIIIWMGYHNRINGFKNMFDFENGWQWKLTFIDNYMAHIFSSIIGNIILSFCLKGLRTSDLNEMYLLTKVFHSLTVKE